MTIAITFPKLQKTSRHASDLATLFSQMVTWLGIQTNYQSVAIKVRYLIKLLHFRLKLAMGKLLFDHLAQYSSSQCWSNGQGMPFTVQYYCLHDLFTMYLSQLCSEDEVELSVSLMSCSFSLSWSMTTVSLIILKDSLTANGLSAPMPVTSINECDLQHVMNHKHLVKFIRDTRQ